MNRQSAFNVQNKTEQTRKHLEELIAVMAPGDQLLPESQLAKRFGVSLITVRRGLEQLVDKGLVYKVHGKGTIVAERTEPTESADPSTFSLVYPVTDMSAYEDPFLRLVVNGISDSFAEHLQSLRLVPLNHLSLGQRLQDPAMSRVLRSGLILVNYRLTSEEWTQLQALHCPVVSIGAQPVSPLVPSVDVDHFAAGRNAGLHLAQEHGRRRLLYIGGKPMGQEYTVRIFKGCVKAWEKAGLPADNCQAFFHPEDTSDPVTATELILCNAFQSGMKFDALLSFGCNMTLTALRLLQEQNLRVPEDVAVIAYNDFPVITQHTAPRISAVHQPSYELGHHAAELLLAMQEDGLERYRGVNQILQATLHPRESCGCILPPK